MANLKEMDKQFDELSRAWKEEKGREEPESTLRFEIFFKDLSYDMQDEFCRIMKTTREQENKMSLIPLAVIEREVE